MTDTQAIDVVTFVFRGTRIRCFVRGSTDYITFVEIDHEIISTIILLPSADSFKKGCCQLQAKVCAQLLVNRLFKPAQEKVWLGELTVPQ